MRDNYPLLHPFVPGRLKAADAAGGRPLCVSHVFGRLVRADWPVAHLSGMPSASVILNWSSGCGRFLQSSLRMNIAAGRRVTREAPGGMPGASVAVQVVSLVLAEQVLDPPVSHVLPAVEAFRIAGQQDLNAVPSTLGHLGRIDARV